MCRFYVRVPGFDPQRISDVKVLNGLDNPHGNSTENCKFSIYFVFWPFLKFKISASGQNWVGLWPISHWGANNTPQHPYLDFFAMG